MSLSFALILMIIALYFVTYRVRIVGLPFYKNGKCDGKDFFWQITMVLLILFNVFRGDFSTDYRGFYLTYYKDILNFGFSALFDSRSVGFSFLCYIANNLFHSYQAAIFMIGFVTVVLYGLAIKKNSTNYLLSFALLIGVDNYIVSFNIIRNVFAAALCFYAMKKIYEGRLFHYIVLVLLASIVHRSALIMLPMYWVLKIDFRKKRNLYALLGMMLVACIGMFFTNQIGRVGLGMLGINSYGDVLNASNYYLGVYTSAFKTIGLFIFVLIFYKLIDFSNQKERIWFNACMLACYFQILAIKINLAQRISYFFSACFILLIPLILSRMKNCKLKTALVIIFLLIYCGLVQNAVTEYWFFWQNKLIPV